MGSEIPCAHSVRDSVQVDRRPEVVRIFFRRNRLKMHLEQQVGFIQGQDNFGEADGSSMAPSYAEDQSAYRSELAGLHGIVLYTNTLCRHHDIH